MTPDLESLDPRDREIWNLIWTNNEWQHASDKIGDALSILYVVAPLDDVCDCDRRLNDIIEGLEGLKDTFDKMADVDRVALMRRLGFTEEQIVRSMEIRDMMDRKIATTASNVASICGGYDDD